MSSRPRSDNNRKTQRQSKPNPQSDAAPTPAPTDDRVIEMWPLAELRPHPQQSVVFDDLSSGELDRLAKDTRINGQNHPVEILRSGVIVCGHRRVAAARQLGWSEIRVRVRDDLANAGDAAVEERLLQDNLLRRQLGPMARARAEQRMREMQPASRHSGDTRDAIAKRLGVSGRTLDRYARLLVLPRVILRMIDDRRMSLAQATRILAASPAQLTEIVSELEAGQSAKDVLRRHLPTKLVGITRRPRQVDIDQVIDYPKWLRDKPDKWTVRIMEGFEQTAALVGEIRMLYLSSDEVAAPTHRTTPSRPAQASNGRSRAGTSKGRARPTRRSK